MAGPLGMLERRSSLYCIQDIANQPEDFIELIRLLQKCIYTMMRGSFPRFVFDKATKQEIIQNIHPRQGEMAEYIPTAMGWATGNSYAIIAFVQNLDQNGQNLLLAGTTGEGTEAAGRLVTDQGRFQDALLKCGIRAGEPLKHFEMLLQLSAMAGSPTNVNVLACHTL